MIQVEKVYLEEVSLVAAYREVRSATMATMQKEDVTHTHTPHIWRK